MQSAAFAVQSSISDRIGCTPAEVIFGEPLSRPIDLTSDSETNCTKCLFNVCQAHQFAKSLKPKLDVSSEIVHKRLAERRDQMKSVYDKHLRNHNFAVGDHVMLWFLSHQCGISQCFQPRWRGPWVITEIIGNTNCRLRDEKGNCKCVHMNQLKKVQTRD